jgi:hypothetical protein
MRTKRFFLLVLLGLFFSYANRAQTLPVINVTTNLPTVSEPNGFAEFVILKTPGPDVTVHFEMLGTAVPGTDYNIVGDANSILVPGSTDAALVRIQVLDDFVVEPDKTITLHLLPDQSYTSGPEDTATIILHSDDPTNLPTVYSFELSPGYFLGLDPTILPPNSTVAAAVYPSLSTTWVSLFLDSLQVASGKPSFGESFDFGSTFADPTPGLHLLTAVASDSRGLSGAGSIGFRVADALLIPLPSAMGYMTNSTLVNTGRVFTYFDAGAGTAAAFIEFPVPAAASNWNGQLFLASPRGNTPGNTPNQIFTYVGDGIITTNDYTAAAELIGTLDPTPSDSDFQIDVTKWTQAAAGGLIGFKLRVDPAFPANTSFDFASQFQNIRLAFFSPSNDVPLYFTWVSAPTNNAHPADQPLTFDLRLYDPDSHVKNVQVSENIQTGHGSLYSIAAEAAIDLPPGTNLFSLAATNLTPGSHTFTIRVTTDGGSVTHSYAPITVYLHDPQGPAHPWFGADGDSKALYLVDAAGRAWVWGDNSYGQLGLGFKGGALARPVMLAAPAGKKWRQFTSNSYCAAGVTDDGLLYGMGQNAAGFSSVFTTPDPTEPSPLPLNGSFYVRRAGLTQNALWIINESSNLVSVFGSASAAKPIADLATGGYQLVSIDGTGNIVGVNSPALAKLPWKTVSTCATHSLALDSAGQLFVWGQNDNGQLPVHSGGSSVLTLTKVSFPPGVLMIAAGNYVSLAVDSNGKLFSWGRNGYTGSTEPFALSRIVQVAMPADEVGWLDVAVGSTFAMALSARGNVYLWGDIPSSTASRHVDIPELVTGLPDLLNASEPVTPTVTFESQSVYLGSQLHMELVGTKGVAFKLESSADFLNWTTVTNIPNATGKTTVAAPFSPSGQLFLRVKP